MPCFPHYSDTFVNALTPEGSYRFADHWYIGTFVDPDNTNNDCMISGGFFARSRFKPR